MATLTNEQIEQKKKQLKQLAEEINAIAKELEEAGAWPLSDDELDDVAGGISVNHGCLTPFCAGTGGVDTTHKDNPVGRPGFRKDGISY